MESNTGLLCPQCGSARVYRSRRRNSFEKLQAWLHYFPYHCHACHYRFSRKTRLPGSNRAFQKILAAALCEAIFVAILLFLIRPPV